MNYDHFIGQVHQRARLSSKGEAVTAVRAVLTALGERLTPEEGANLAAQLPTEIAYYLREGGVYAVTKYSLKEFYDRIAGLEGCDVRTAVFHTKVVCDVVREAVSPGEISDVMAQLPGEMRMLFEPPRPSASPSA